MISTIPILFSILLPAIFLALYAWHLIDHGRDRQAMNHLLVSQPTDPPDFDPAMVADLPEPVRRFFRYSIEPGTPLYTVADISMTGTFALGDADKHRNMTMTARQVLAFPVGFVWKMRARSGSMAVSGSDSQSWTRFWMLGILPVARTGGNDDHARSAFGRYAAEAVFWTPAAVLPGPGCHWQALNDHRLRATLTHQGMEQPVELNIDDDGRPLSIRFMRWSNANPGKTFQWQPFGGYLSEYRDFGGMRLPTRVEAGNHFGTDDYFPFFNVEVKSIRFPE